MWSNAGRSQPEKSNDACLAVRQDFFSGLLPILERRLKSLIGNCPPQGEAPTSDSLVQRSGGRSKGPACPHPQPCSLQGRRRRTRDTEFASLAAWQAHRMNCNN